MQDTLMGMLFRKPSSSQDGVLMCWLPSAGLTYSKSGVGAGIGRCGGCCIQEQLFLNMWHDDVFEHQKDDRRCSRCECPRIMTALLCQTRNCHTLFTSLITALLSPACCRYAVDQLTWLVAETSNTAAPAYLANLQQRIEECDRAGSRNSSLPAGENLSSFVDRVGRVGSAADVQTVVSHIP